MGPLVVTANQVKKASAIDLEKYKKNNKTIRRHLLSHMSDPMFDLFVTQKSTKDIWCILESHYGGDGARRKKYIVEKCLQFQMTDDKPVVEQIHEYGNLVANVLSEGMKMCEILEANVLLENSLPIGATTKITWSTRRKMWNFKIWSAKNVHKRPTD